MWFFSNFLTFSRLSREFEDRIAQLETRNAALRRDLAELDEFTHRIARKRYQETYTPPSDGSSQTRLELPAETQSGAAEALVVGKQALWDRVRTLRGQK
jgi:uncharacterized protein YdcH (DUF465 family)